MSTVRNGAQAEGKSLPPAVGADAEASLARTLVIKDREGVLDQQTMLELFKMAVTQTPALHRAVELGSTTQADGTVVFVNAKTQAMWVGWALGMRCGLRKEFSRTIRVPPHETQQTATERPQGEAHRVL